MEEIKQETRIGKLTLEKELHNYRVYIEIEPGADIPLNLREILISLVREEERKLRAAEIQLIEEVFRNDITNLEAWAQVKVQSALVNSHIGIKLKSGPQLTFNGLFQLPKEFIGFTGRRKELEALESHIRKPKVVTQKISGTGGVGKTQLANHFARLKIIEGYYKWVVWIHATKPDEINAQYVDLASRLGIDVEQMKDERLIELIYIKLLDQGAGLIIYDDVEDYQNIKKFLPSKYNINNIQLLMTSRNTLDWGQEIKKIHLDIFSPLDAINYIENTLNANIYIEEDATLLGEIMGRFPLALTQALAYINNNPISINEYIEAFKLKKENQRRLLDYPPFQTDDHTGTVLATINLSLEKITSVKARDLLDACSYLAPEVPIDVKMLRFCTEDILEFNEAIEDLKRYSLFKDSRIANYVEIHQVVQDVILLNHSQDLQFEVLSTWSKVLQKYVNSSTMKSLVLPEEEPYRAVKLHVKTIADKPILMQELPQYSSIKINIYGILGVAYKVSGDEQLALQTFKKQLQIIEENELSDLNLACTCHINLGVALLSCGKPANALKHFKKSREIGKTKFKVGINPELALILLNIGIALKQLGNLTDAMINYIEAYQILISCNNEDALIGSCMMQIGIYVKECGNPSKAIEILEEAMKILQKDQKDQKHHKKLIALCIMNIGICYKNFGNSLEAMKKYQKALPLLKEAFGERHAHVGRCLGNMGSSLDKSRYIEANELFQEAKSIFISAFGEDHLLVGHCIMQLANIKSECNLCDEAIKLYNNAKYIITRWFGENESKELARCISNMGQTYSKIGNQREAIKHVQNALDIFKRTLVEGHHEIAKCMVILGQIKMNNADYEEAKILIEEALPTLRKTFGNGHEQVIECEKLLAVIQLCETGFKM